MISSHRLRLAAGLSLSIALWLLSAPMNARAQYVYTFGGTSFDRGVDVGVDAAGNAYVIGEFRGTMALHPDPGSPQFTTAGQDVFVASYDPEGALRFGFRLGAGSADRAGGVAVNGAGTFAVTGSQPFGTIDYDPDPNAVANRTGRLFIASYDLDGTFRFAVTPEPLTPASTGMGEAVAIDDDGNVHVTGYFAGILEFNPGSENGRALESEGFTDMFVASYASDGAFRYAFRLGGVDADYGLGIATDGAGNVYVTGEFRETVAFDPLDTDDDGDRVEITANGGADLFLAGYTSEGVFRFVLVPQSAAPNGHDAGYGLAVDAADNVYLAGEFSGTVAFDPNDSNGDSNREERVASGNGTGFLASYTADGMFRFATVLSGGSSSARALSTAPDGVTSITGSFGGEVDFDAGPGSALLTSVAGTDVFVASYRADGAFRSVFGFGGNGLNVGNGVAVARSGDVLVTGGFTNVTDFGIGGTEGEHTSAGQNDVFIARYPGPEPVRAEPWARDGPESIQISSPYPNPFTTRAHLDVHVERDQHVVISLYDLRGRRVGVPFRGIIAAGERRRIEVEAGSLPSGPYLVRVEGETFRSMHRVIHVR